MSRDYNPTPNELHACGRRVFVEAEHFDADEERTPERVAQRKARFERAEDTRQAEAVALVERVRSQGRTLVGTPKGYAYRVGQSMRK